MFSLNDNLKINNALVARTSKLSRYFNVFGQRVVKTSMSLDSWFELHAACYIYMYVYNKILLKIIELQSQCFK